MSTSYILPLKAPNPLPATGVDVVTFKEWKNTLVAHIQQDKNHHHFMEDGKYSTWQAAEFGRRIAQLHDEDPEKVIFCMNVYILEMRMQFGCFVDKVLILWNTSLQKIERKNYRT